MRSCLGAAMLANCYNKSTDPDSPKRELTRVILEGSLLVRLLELLLRGVRGDAKRVIEFGLFHHLDVVISSACFG